MRPDLGHLVALAILASAYVAFMLAGVSERLGAVTGMRPVYRYGYIGAGLLGIAGLSRLVLDFAGGAGGLRLIAYDLPLAGGALMVLMVTLSYWGWLLHER